MTHSAQAGHFTCVAPLGTPAELPVEADKSSSTNKKTKPTSGEKSKAITNQPNVLRPRLLASNATAIAKTNHKNTISAIKQSFVKKHILAYFLQTCELWLHKAMNYG
jgi:hypothetical protein